MSAWNAAPVVVTCAITGADDFRAGDRRSLGVDDPAPYGHGGDQFQGGHIVMGGPVGNGHGLGSVLSDPPHVTSRRSHDVEIGFTCR